MGPLQKRTRSSAPAPPPGGARCPGAATCYVIRFFFLWRDRFQVGVIVATSPCSAHVTVMICACWR